MLRIPSIIAALLLAMLPTARCQAEAPNFVLCMADDQGWGDVGYNGNDRIHTPTLDEMAATGLRFDRFYAAAPVCSPTRGSVLTGRHPNRFGCFRWGYTLRPQEVTVAEALRSAGYATGHFGKWHLGSVRADSPVSPGNSGFEQWLSAPNFYENDSWMSDNGRAVKKQGESSMIAVDAALNFIQTAVGRKQPFLAVVWFGSPHLPHIAVDEDREHYRDMPEAMQHYYGEITGIDRAMGKLRRQLRKLGVADNTLLWYTSDNGATRPGDKEGSNGTFAGKKGTLYEGGIRVPGIIEWPARIKAHAASDVPANTVDIYPTLLQLAGIKMQHQPVLDGISLVSVIDGERAAREKPMGFWDYEAPGKPVRTEELLVQLHKEQSGQAPPADAPPHPDAGSLDTQYDADDRQGHSAWIDNAFKLHRITDKDGRVAYKLFDLEKDPQEQNDLSEKMPEQLAKMQKQLEQWQLSVIESLNGNDYLQ